jgi:hypothetical protein
MMRFSAVGSLLLSALFLTACLPSDEFDGFRVDDAFDRDQGLSRKDYRNLNSPKLPEEAPGAVRSGAPPVPDLAQILAAPRPPKIDQSKRVSIAVTDDVPLRDVLLELSRLANVDVEIGSGIEGGINFRATNRPFNEVVERIADLAGLGLLVLGKRRPLPEAPSRVMLIEGEGAPRGRPFDLQAAFAKAAAEARRLGGLPAGAVLVVAGLGAPVLGLKPGVRLTARFTGIGKVSASFG